MTKNNQIDLVEFPASSPEELQKVTSFFTEVFGWQYKDWGGVYSDTQDSGVASGVNASNISARQAMPLAVIYSEDVEAAKQKVVDAGGTVTQDIYEFPGGRRFHFTDPAGNELAVWGK